MCSDIQQAGTVYLAELQARLKQFADARDWGQFHAPKNLVMALSVEASELLEHFQWLTAEESQELEAEKLREVAHEMADVFIYLMRLATRLEVDMVQAVEEKMAINEAKYPAERVRGSKKKYTEYQDQV